MKILVNPNITVPKDCPAMRLHFVGDIMLSRGVGDITKIKGMNFLWSGISTLINDCDFLFGNLECVLTERGNKNPESASCFRASPEAAKALPKFEALTLANNHIRDYGDDGINDTIETLNQVGIGHLGVGKTQAQALAPYLLKKKDSGLSVALFSVTTMKNVTGKKGFWHVASVDELLNSEKLIHKTKNVANVLIALVHMGYERVVHPSPEARNIAKKIIDLGFHAIICHHPHIVQGYEIYREKPIIYSLGDFVFDGSDQIRKESIIAALDLTSQGVIQMKFHPVYIDANFRPVPASEERSKQILSRIKAMTEKIANCSSDESFFESAGQSFVGSQVKDWRRSWEHEKFKGIIKKLRRFRPIHAHLLFRSLMSRIR